MMSFCLIILAGGNSDRFKSNLAKPYHKIAGKTLIEISLKKMSNFKQIKKTVVVYNPKHLNKLKELNLKNVKLIKGGNSRQKSTLNALKYLIKQKGIQNVLIHDAARPNFSSKLIMSIIKNMKSVKLVNGGLGKNRTYDTYLFRVLLYY